MESQLAAVDSEPQQSQALAEVLQALRNEDEETWLDSKSLRRSNSKFTHQEIIRLNVHRVDLEYFRDLLLNKSGDRDRSEQAISETFSTGYKNEQELIRCVLALCKESAKVCLLGEQYEDAIQEFKRALGIIMKAETHSSIFPREFYNSDYLRVFQKRPENHRMAIFLDALTCCCGIASAYINLGDIPRLEVMEYLQEVSVLYECFKYHTTGIHSRLLRIPHLSIASFRIEASHLYVRQFLHLKNTAAACYYAWRIKRCYGNWFPEDVHEFSELDKKGEEHQAFKLAAYRHPHVTVTDKWSLEYPQLQLRGIWSKVRALSGVRPPNIPNPNAWIWKSRLYIRWGKNESNKLCYLDLKNPLWWNYPKSFSKEHCDVQPSLAKPLVHNDIVWFFFGNLDILRFNLVSETWDSIRTNFRGTWPFSSDGIDITTFSVYNVERYKSKMCVFGASSKTDSLFMVLDLKTLRWRRFDLLQNNSNCELTQSTPLGRSCGNVWVVEEEDRLYVMYGEILLDKAKRNFNAELYADLWSFSFNTELWTRERLRGNFPSPRLAMAHAYNNKIKKVVAFGGMTDGVPFLVVKNGEPKPFPPFYADAFVMDTDTLLWKQVITRNFPAWRACARMLVDDIDGNIYLYGGYSSNIIAFGKDDDGYLAYGNVWRLDLEIPGHNGHFDERAFEEFSPLKAGAFRRCFQCERSGQNYLRCQGACGGKAIYCSKECQRMHWKAHKSAYGCRKL